MCRTLPRFKADAAWVLEPGDLLYVPPYIPHEGVALGDTGAEAAAALASEVMRRADELGIEGRIADKPPSKRKTAAGSDSGTSGSVKAKSRKSPKSKKKNAL